MSMFSSLPGMVTDTGTEVICFAHASTAAWQD